MSAPQTILSRLFSRPLVSCILLVTVTVLCWLPATPAMAAHPAAARGTGGAVAAAAPAATEAGLQVLRQGGNAADAAVAVALALAVVHPSAGNLGGGGFAVLRFGDEVTALDFREQAPAAATADMYLNEDGTPNPIRSLVGPLAAGVPGTPAGLWELHQQRGSLAWVKVVTPAIELAANGFVVTERLAAMVHRSRDLLARFPETAAVWLPGGEPPAPGSTMRLPALAATLRRYAEQGPAALTTGAAAAAIEQVSKRYGGVLTAADLTAYRPLWRTPVSFTTYGWQVASMPLPSSGGIIMAQTCALAEQLGWHDLPRAGADRAHLLAEIWRRAYTDRFLLGDPATTQADQQQLLDPAWLARRAAEIDMAKATPSDHVGHWQAAPPEPAETTHLSVVDMAGNAVALTTTLNGSFGCGLLVPELGYLLNNEMDDFAAAPGQPNLYGLVQGEANAVAPGKRMLSSMSPTVAWQGEEVVALGAPGGSRIPTGTTQVLLNLVVDHDALQTAVNRARLHHQWLPDTLAAEPDAFSPETAAELERRGHQLGVLSPIGLVNVAHSLAGGVVEAAADPRGPGAAGVVNPAPGHQ